MASLSNYRVQILGEADEATRHAIIETHLEALDTSVNAGDPTAWPVREAPSTEYKRYRGMRPYTPVRSRHRVKSRRIQMRCDTDGSAVTKAH
ncbi:hypothetical protein NU219Hw_g2718t1 [Hortaea werneckii]